MKKNFFLMLLLLTSISFYGQKYITKTGNLKFEASVASFEEVAAEIWNPINFQKQPLKEKLRILILKKR